ncbi:hypothetical protein ACFE04_021142 [Oxalis oulophora]
MATGSSSNRLKNPHIQPKIEPFVSKKGHNPKDLRSWAKQTGFVSGESSNPTSTIISHQKFDTLDVEIERCLKNQTGGKIEIDPILGRNRINREEEEEEIELELTARTRPRGNWRRGFGDESNTNEARNTNGNGGNVLLPVVTVIEPKKEEDKDVENGVMHPVEVDGSGYRDEGWNTSDMKYGLRDNPGFVRLIYYGLQHYLSLAGSLMFIPLLIVPAMGGTDNDTATVISTMLLVTGITTILHSYFGTRLPLVQGSSFVYLTPALIILNAKENRNLSEHKFRHIMKELQGAIIIGSIFQSFLGFSGLMSLFLRLINPVVVAPTMAAVGLSFFSYGFPQAGSCVEISIPQIILVFGFTLYLRGISIFGHRLFRIYAVCTSSSDVFSKIFVPLSVMIIWTYAFFLTAGGAFNYEGCSPDIPSSNILTDSCRRHAYSMKHCRTDVSNAMRTAPWVRIPYPFQWGIPVFHFRTSMIMIFVSLVASVDSVGTYHSASLLVASKPPTPCIVSRGIAMEGFCSILAGLWGVGTGSTTLTENVYTINVTKVASRRAVEMGAVFLILFSFVGKIGAILASIPQALAASVLCFMWGLIVALGLSNMQYSKTASFRNITIVGVSLFLGMSIPSYFYQFQPETSLILPSYFLPYSAASDGPVHTGSKQLDFAINGIMSMSMVVTLLVAFILDNTVPGSKEERGVYIWSHAEDLVADSSLSADYSLPRKVAQMFCWGRCF